jgi:hypothetical protein
MPRASNTCPHCGQPVLTSQGLWSQRRQAKGKCGRCGLEKTGKDIGRWNCRDCRLTIAANSRKRYALKGRKDRPAA